MPLDNFWLGSAFCRNSGASRSDPTRCSVPLPAAGEVWATATRIGRGNDDDKAGSGNDGSGGNQHSNGGVAMIWPLVFAQLTDRFELQLCDVWQHLKGVPSMHLDGNVAAASRCTHTYSTRFENILGHRFAL
jgi:hypothetical protein